MASWNKTETQIEWSSADTKSVSAAGSETSDAHTLQSDTVQAWLKIQADNAGTPASGDDLDVYVQYGGDPDADTTEEYDNQGDYFCTLDTYTDDPAVRVVEFVPIPGETLKITAANGASSNSITVGLTVIERRFTP